MRRIINENLMKWKDSTHRKPLLINGARQVGKTYAVMEFGRNHYENVVCLNFESTPRLAELFDDSISPADLIKKIEIFFSVTVKPDTTLLFFDEVQLCNRALTSLKYFNEVANQYHIIAAGSLLGIALNRENFSFPVGKVNMLNVYPMNFEEFLWANGKEKMIPLIEESFSGNTKMPNVFHDSLMELYRTYLGIGGMPEVVSEYITAGSFMQSENTISEIYNSYITDITKHADHKQVMKIIGCFDSVGNQLAKPNQKFKYSLVKPKATSTYFEDAIDWLKYARIVLPCYRLEHVDHPLVMSRNSDFFKLYLCDVGILRSMMKVSIKDVVLGDFDNIYSGILAENYVACEFFSQDLELFYWSSGNTAEVDYVIRVNGAYVPVEVKANTHNRSKSLNEYIGKYHPEYAIRISGKNFGFENGIKSIPLYAAFCLARSKAEV